MQRARQSSMGWGGNNDMYWTNLCVCIPRLDRLGRHFGCVVRSKNDVGFDSCHSTRDCGVHAHFNCVSHDRHVVIHVAAQLDFHQVACLQRLLLSAKDQALYHTRKAWLSNENECIASLSRLTFISTAKGKRKPLHKRNSAEGPGCVLPRGTHHFSGAFGCIGTTKAPSTTTISIGESRPPSFTRPSQHERSDKTSHGTYKSFIQLFGERESRKGMSRPMETEGLTAPANPRMSTPSEQAQTQTLKLSVLWKEKESERESTALLLIFWASGQALSTCSPRWQISASPLLLLTPRHPEGMNVGLCRGKIQESKDIPAAGKLS